MWIPHCWHMVLQVHPEKEQLCQEGVYAFVFASSQRHDLYLCSEFWLAPRGKTRDSQPGTIIHELSHFDNVMATKDHVYGTCIHACVPAWPSCPPRLAGACLHTPTHACRYGTDALIKLARDASHTARDNADSLEAYTETLTKPRAATATPIPPATAAPIDYYAPATDAPWHSFYYGTPLPSHDPTVWPTMTPTEFPTSEPTDTPTFEPVGANGQTEQPEQEWWNQIVGLGGSDSQTHKDAVTWMMYKKKEQDPAATPEPKVQDPAATPEPKVPCTCNGCEIDGKCLEIGKKNGKRQKVMKSNKKSVEMCAKGQGIWCTNKKVKHSWTHSCARTCGHMFMCAPACCRVARRASVGRVARRASAGRAARRASAMITLSRCLALCALYALHALHAPHTLHCTCTGTGTGTGTGMHAHAGHAHARAHTYTGRRWQHCGKLVRLCLAQWLRLYPGRLWYDWLWYGWLWDG